jgi:hypothetical protein
MRKDFFALEGEDLYIAGLGWSGITDDMRREALYRLEGEELYEAGHAWEGIKDDDE